MEKVINAQDDVAEKRLVDDDYIETELMMYSDEIFEDEHIRLFDGEGEDSVILSIIAKGISIQFSYEEWSDLIRLAMGDSNNNTFDSTRSVLEYDLGDSGNADKGFALYFRNNYVSVRFGFREYARLKKSIQLAGSPYHWASKSSQ